MRLGKSGSVFLDVIRPLQLRWASPLGISSPKRLAAVYGQLSGDIDKALGMGLRFLLRAFLPHRSVESLDDFVQLRTTCPRTDVEQIVCFDDGTQLAIAELAAAVDATLRTA